MWTPAQALQALEGLLVRSLQPGARSSQEPGGGGGGGTAGRQQQQLGAVIDLSQEQQVCALGALVAALEKVSCPHLHALMLRLLACCFGVLGVQVAVLQEASQTPHMHKSTNLQC